MFHPLDEGDIEDLKERVERPPEELCRVSSDDVVDYLTNVATLRDELMRKFSLSSGKPKI